VASLKKAKLSPSAAKLNDLTRIIHDGRMI
jgi:hypothetical protein